MTASIQYDELCLERFRCGSRRSEGDWILPSVYDEGGAVDVTQRVREVEVAQRAPNGLLLATGHAERSEGVCGLAPRELGLELAAPRA